MHFTRRRRWRRRRRRSWVTASWKERERESLLQLGYRLKIISLALGWQEGDVELKRDTGAHEAAIGSVQCEAVCDAMQWCSCTAVEEEEEDEEEKEEGPFESECHSIGRPTPARWLRGTWRGFKCRNNAFSYNVSVKPQSAGAALYSNSSFIQSTWILVVLSVYNAANHTRSLGRQSTFLYFFFLFFKKKKRLNLGDFGVLLSVAIASTRWQVIHLLLCLSPSETVHNITRKWMRAASVQNPNVHSTK